jgi:osmotically-inducible protein OsmY
VGKLRSFAMGVALGVGTMYLLDPDKGRRRRALARDQLIHGRNLAGERLAGRQRDLRNRAQGVVAETTARLREREVDDVVLSERVRSQLGRLVAHAGNIDVSAHAGRVTLRGSVPRNDLGTLLVGVSSVRGVDGVDNQLEVYDTPGSNPNLQGS